MLNASKSRFSHNASTAVAALLSLAAAHCSSGDGAAGFREGSTGGNGGVGGTAPPGTGGFATATGGTSATGGAGGAPGSGGAMGGTSATGGTSASGGATASGGTASSGGGVGTGGASAVTSGCGVDPVPSGTGSVDLGGTARTYVFDVPPGYDKNKQYPVLFGFHGATTSGASFRSRYYGNLASAAGNDAIMVYPDALGDPTAWNNTADLPFFDALLAKIESQYCVDTKRIFAAGHSSGGFFSNTLGCQRGDVLRGIAPVSGGGPFVFGGTTCKGEVAVWLAHGTNDPTVMLSSGQGSRDHWVTANGCDATTSTPVTPSPCIEYAGCDPGFAVRWCQHDGDHNWPTFAPEGIWSFFKGL